MSNKKPLIILIIILAAGLALGGFFWFKHQQTVQKETKALNLKKLEEIKKLIIGDPKCSEALPELEQLLKSDPKNTDAWSFKGVCEFQSNKFSDAKASFQKALSINPELPGPKNYLAFMGNAENASTPSLPAINQENFESEFKGLIDFTNLTFIEATDRSNGLGKYYFGKYSSTLTTTNLSANLITSFKKSKIILKDSETDQKNSKILTGSAGEKLYTLSIFPLTDGNGNLLLIDFENTK
jgi:tetratricopeptide (TPR) repeat protein